MCIMVQMVDMINMFACRFCPRPKERDHCSKPILEVSQVAVKEFKDRRRLAYVD